MSACDENIASNLQQKMAVIHCNWSYLLQYAEKYGSDTLNRYIHKSILICIFLIVKIKAIFSKKPKNHKSTWREDSIFPPSRQKIFCWISTINRRYSF